MTLAVHKDLSTFAAFAKLLEDALGVTVHYKEFIPRESYSGEWPLLNLVPKIHVDKTALPIKKRDNTARVTLIVSYKDATQAFEHCSDIAFKIEAAVSDNLSIDGLTRGVQLDSVDYYLIQADIQFTFTYRYTSNYRSPGTAAN